MKFSSLVRFCKDICPHVISGAVSEIDLSYNATSSDSVELLVLSLCLVQGAGDSSFAEGKDCASVAGTIFMSLM